MKDSKIVLFFSLFCLILALVYVWLDDLLCALMFSIASEGIMALSYGIAMDEMKGALKHGQAN